MTYLLKDIADHLKGSTDVSDEFGIHFYPDFIPQGISWEQAVVLSDISNVPDYYLGGESGTHTSTMQIDVWTDGKGAKPRERLNTLTELVRNRLSGYRGQFGTGCYGTARIVRNNTIAAQPTDGSDNHRLRASMDFEIIHTADVPDLA